MNNTNRYGTLLNIMALVSWVLAYLLAGRSAWYIILPDSLLGMIVFIPVWITIGFLAQRLLFLVVTFLAVLMEIRLN